jgi:hypothetical protein
MVVMSMFIYFDFLATILDEPKSTKHGWNFLLFLNTALKCSASFCSRVARDFLKTLKNYFPQ